MKGNQQNVHRVNKLNVLYNKMRIKMIFEKKIKKGKRKIFKNN